ncbi:MAG TPA: Maf family protein, partial [Flavisolibacter sp.]|nr:Maf family protein [Flavisolibacter sp.]
MRQIILASQSPRRKQLLEWAEINFEIIISATDETYPPGLPPQNIATHIAQKKAEAIIDRAGDKLIIAADTIVVLEN